MTPALRLAISLVLSLLLWLPTIPGALVAHEDPARIAGRYLIALILSRIGVGLVFRVINAYASQIPQDETEDEDEAVRGDEPTEAELIFGRRADDATVHEDGAPSMLDDALADVSETTSLVP